MKEFTSVSHFKPNFVRGESTMSMKSLQIKKRKRKFLKSFRAAKKLSLVGFHIGAIAAIVAVVNFVPARESRAARTDTEISSGVGTLDTLSSADVAARVALAANILEGPNAANQADSLNFQVDIGGGNSLYLPKPHLVQTGIKTKKDIDTYTIINGDTVSSVAQKYGISADTIRWANNIQGEALVEGKKLTILPLSGVQYTVKDGDTVEKIASSYSANKDDLINFNDFDVDALKPGEKIIIPGGRVPAPVAPPARIAQGASGSGFSYTAPYSGAFSFGTSAIYGGNGYALGYCTWHAANRRIEIGRPVPRNLGNAITWVSAAQAAGLAVGDVPQAGAVIWHKFQGGLGHVAFVESVNPDGSYLVSDMNYAGNWNRVTYRTVKASETYQYRFIY